MLIGPRVDRGTPTLILKAFPPMSTMTKGQISVETENIFPIIKQFLYNDQEIFLRELVSNAVDATSKIKAAARKGDFDGELGDLTIQIALD